jgi:hypothetical protein
VRRHLLEFVPQCHRKKIMISAYSTHQGFVFIKTLLETERFSFVFFAETILPSLISYVYLLRPKMQVQGYWLYLDNVRPHNSVLSPQNWRAGIHQIALAAIFLWLGTLWLLPIRMFGKKNFKGWTSDGKIGWSLWWERFWVKSRFGRSEKCSTNARRDYTGALQMAGSMSK